MLRQRLINTLNTQISNGFFTERGIARLSGISQPQIHNILKGARTLTPESADLLMAVANVALLDLISEDELKQYSEQKSELLIKPVEITRKAAQTVSESALNLQRAS